MRSIVIFVVNILFLTIVELVFKIIIREGIINYFQYFDFYSFKLDVLFCFLAVIIIGSMYAFIFRLCFKKAPLGFQCIVTALLGALFFYLLGALANGFTIDFEITSEKLIALSPLFLIGFVIPFSGRWVATLLNKIWKSK